MVKGIPCGTCHNLLCYSLFPLRVNNQQFLQTSRLSLLPGAEQEESPERDGTLHADPPRRVHAGAGAQAAEDPAEAAHGPDTTAAPDGDGEPDRVQQTTRARTPPQTRAGAAAATEESQSKWMTSGLK